MTVMNLEKAAGIGDLNAIRLAIAEQIISLQEALSRPNLQTRQM
jgi:hypothetical protein